MKTQYKTSDALLYAVVAFHANQDRVVREFYNDGTNKFQANRVIIQDCLNGSVNHMVRDRDHKEAQEMKQYLEQTRIIQELKGGRNDQFLQNMVELLSKEVITQRDFGLLAWAPKVAADYQKKDAVNEVSSQYERTSRWIGAVKDRVNFNFTVIECRFVQSMGIWSVYGHTENGDLIHYWASREDRIIRKGHIQGRISKLTKDSFHNGALVTVVNYVKEVK